MCASSLLLLLSLLSPCAYARAMICIQFKWFLFRSLHLTYMYSASIYFGFHTIVFHLPCRNERIVFHENPQLEYNFINTHHKPIYGNDNGDDDDGDKNNYEHFVQQNSN